MGYKASITVFIHLVGTLIIFSKIQCISCSTSATMTPDEKKTLKLITMEMFDHAYGAYKEHAFPADELMPLSCKGRYRGSETDRGDIDESLGNFSLTLIDTLDTLAILGKLEEFETQVKYVILNVSFNADVVVSVFETNIRVLGGLLGAHSMAVALKDSGKAMLWYQGELLPKAMDIADRLLGAFNTSTGIPYPKINLRYGINKPNSRVGHETDTCTACAGTMIMEFGALSRLTGKSIYEEKAHKAMEALWKYRSRHSDLVGTTINIHSGDWTRRDSGVGAGIDSYYEYCLKAYILLGDDSYLEKFNKHYSAIKRYLRQGFMFVDVMMHQPDQQIRSHVDSLQAFWPGLQVLKGDLKPAIEMHEILYKVAKKYKFLPEAFTTNFDVHWGQHPLRPEFVESTYFLYQATKDPYYLTVGKHIIQALEEHARVPCGYAALKDLRTLSHEDKMDSFVLAETFKYLYLLFSDESEHVININDYIFTTEAHLLPLSLSVVPSSKSNNDTKSTPKEPILDSSEDDDQSCPRPMHYTNAELRSFAEFTREKVSAAVNKNNHVVNPPNPSCKTTQGTDFASMVQKTAEKFLLQFNSKRPRKLKAEEFVMTNEKHLLILKDLGITLSKESNGKVQLVHQAVLASSPEDAEEGIKFMQEMVQLAKTKGEHFLGELQTRVVQILSPPFNGKTVLPAGSAQFGADLSRNEMGVSGETIMAEPFNACQNVKNGDSFANRIVLIQRGECMFIDKVRLSQALGALGVIIIDHTEGTSAENSQPFGMSGDSNPGDVFIPSVFLFKREGDLLLQHMKEQGGNVEVRLGAKAAKKSVEPAVKVNIVEDGPIHMQSVPDLTKTSKEGSPSADLNDLLPEKVLDKEQTKGHDVTTTQNIEIKDDGSKVITTTSSYIGPNDKGEQKEHVQNLIQTCPTPECDRDITFKMNTFEKDVPEKTESPNDSANKESGNTEHTTDEKNSQILPENIDADEKSLKYIKAVENLNNLYKPETNSYIDTIVSESLKEKITKKSKANGAVGEEDCGFPGCSNIEEQIKSINDMAMGLVENIDKMNEEVLDNMEKKETIEKSEKQIQNDGSLPENLPESLPESPPENLPESFKVDGVAKKTADRDTDETVDETDDTEDEEKDTEDEDLKFEGDERRSRKPYSNSDQSRTRTEL